MTPTVRHYVAALGPGDLPAYVYDLNALRAHAATIRAALPAGVELYYAAKANPEPEILSLLSTVVNGYEVASGGELAHLRKAVPGAPLAFGGPGKTPDEIARAVELGVERVHVESEHELRLLAAAATHPVGVLLRVNLPFDAGPFDTGPFDAGPLGSVALSSVPLAMGGRPTPFGIDPARIDACLALLASPECHQLRLLGIHAHLASGLDAPAQLAVAEHIVDWTARLAQRNRVRLDEVNIGGGMAVDYTDPATRFDWTAFAAGLTRILDRRPSLRLRIEPGRALTAYCGWYATDVLDVKPSHGEEFAVLRGGTHHLRTPAARGHNQPFTVLPVDAWPHPWPRPTATADTITLVGQLCTPKDILARRVPAAGLRAGDRVVFAMAGAYAWNISHHSFLMHPHPGTHLIT